MQLHFSHIFKRYSFHFRRFYFVSNILLKETQPGFDALGAWDNQLDLPILVDASIKHGVPIPKITVKDIGLSSICGKRPYQEDRYLVEDLDGILCCTVFDGHAGSECSEFCRKNISAIVLKNFKIYTDLEAVLHYTFLDLQKQYEEWVDKNQLGLRSGTTATVCLIKDGVQLAVGHVGDSRALLCRSGLPLRLTQDHCPSLKSEKERIEQSGGSVTIDNVGRNVVNSVLNMSRSIGDLHLKSYGVTALPDTRKIKIRHGKDSFLLLTTDGINFVLRDSEACDIVSQSEDPFLGANTLTDQASSLSSEDNLTAIVIPLGSWGKYTKSASMFFSFGIGRDMSKSSRYG